MPADAAAIVAAVNSLPDFLKLATDALDLADELADRARHLHEAAAEPGRSLGAKWDGENRALDLERQSDRLRSVVVAALGQDGR